MMPKPGPIIAAALAGALLLGCTSQPPSPVRTLACQENPAEGAAEVAETGPLEPGRYAVVLGRTGNARRDLAIG